MKAGQLWRVCLIANKSFYTDTYDRYFNTYPEACKAFAELCIKYQINFLDIVENKEAKQAHTITQKYPYRVMLFNYRKPKTYFLT